MKTLQLKSLVSDLKGHEAGRESLSDNRFVSGAPEDWL